MGDDRNQNSGTDKNCSANRQPELEVIRTIREARSRLKITQNELARRTGIDQGDISKLEHGTRNPSLRLLKRLADGLDMDLEIKFVPRNRDEDQNPGKSDDTASENQAETESR